MLTKTAGRAISPPEGAAWLYVWTEKQPRPQRATPARGRYTGASNPSSLQGGSGRNGSFCAGVIGFTPHGFKIRIFSLLQPGWIVQHVHWLQQETSALGVQCAQLLRRFPAEMCLWGVAV